ncbi:MAG: hypothetical protein ACRDGN_16755 [bacterium]
MMFRSLDFIYAPSSSVEEELSYYAQALGGEAVFSIRAFGTRVAAVRLAEGPMLLFAEHLKGEKPILIFRVDDFEQSIKTLRARGVRGQRLEIPHGPCFSFEAGGGQRLAIYELTRPDANAHFAGRFDP